MKAHTTVPFVDTNVIPDRNAGIGSLLWDLQHPHDPDRDGPPLLNPAFAFIDVGVSRAQVSAALKTLLAGDLGMDVEYVATERPEAVPYANITLLGDRAQTIRRCLSRMISSRDATREVKDWHYVVDRDGKVCSLAYAYELHGNEVWESYFMGRPFLYAGERVEFSNPPLDEVLAPDVPRIEARIDAERQRECDASRPAPSWDGYCVTRNPLEAGLAASGITLQTTDVPRRVEGRQNVLFLGNVLHHYPHDEQARELDRVAASMEAGDVVVIQMDGVETPSIEVLHIAPQGARTTRERVRWINTRTLEVEMRARGSGAWRRVHLEPEVTRMVRPLIEGLGRSQDDHTADVRGPISHLLRTFFRAVPVEVTRRIAIREAVRRLPANAEANP